MKHLYLLGAAAGLVTAVYFGTPYILSPGASVAGFVALANANAPAATLSADIAVVYLVANAWLVVEGRRLGMRHLWAYVLGNTLIAVAFGLSLFLWARERRLAAAGSDQAAP